MHTHFSMRSTPLEFVPLHTLNGTLKINIKSIYTDKVFFQNFVFVNFVNRLITRRENEGQSSKNFFPIFALIPQSPGSSVGRHRFRSILPYLGYCRSVKVLEHSEDKSLALLEYNVVHFLPMQI